MIKFMLVANFAILFSLTACTNAEPTRVPEPTPSATAVIAEVVVRETAVPPTNTPNPSATPTQTPPPETTPTAMATATATMIASPIPSPTESFWDSDLAPAQNAFRVVDQVGGRINTVTAQDSIAYVGVGPRLFLLDVSQPEIPVTLGQSDILPNLIQRIAVVDNTAYVLTDDESGFWIVDVSQPTQPQIISFFVTAVPINFLREWNGRLYVSPSARGEDALIYATDNPIHPELIGVLPDEYYPIANDQYVFTSGTREENQITILVADASDLMNLRPISEITTTFNGYLIAIDDQRYYFISLDGMPTLWIVDKEDPSNTPSKLDIEISPFAHGIHVENQIIYLTENFSDAGSYGSSLYAFDVSQTNTRELERLRTGNRSYQTFIDENIVYVAAGEKLVIAGIDEERNMDLLVEWHSLGDLVWIDATGNQIFSLNSWDNRIYQFERIGWQTLQLLHEHQGEGIDEVILAEGNVFTTGWFEGIHRFQSNTIPWQETATFDRPNRIEFVDRMLVQDEILYARLDGDLSVFDISNPSEIQQIGQLDWETYHTELFSVNQNTLYTWTNEGLKSTSITDPAAPQEIGLLPDELDSHLHDLAANNTHMYLLTVSCLDTNCNDRGINLQVVDISDPANMTLVAQLPMSSSLRNIKLLGNKLLLTGEEFWLVDITNPTQPQVNGRFSTPGNAQDAIIVNDLIYVADGAGGLLVLRLVEE